MAFHVFPYREEEPQLHGAPVPRPTVNLTVTGSVADLTVKALVDTGAPFCVFGRAVAEAVGVDMNPGAGPDRDIKILGGSHTARSATVQLELPPFSGLHWDALCHFLYADLDLSFVGVLGHEGFLDRWIASFNYYDGYFIIEEHDDFVERLGVDPTEVVKGNFDSEWDRPTAH